ncbi:MAG: M56 family metallopeptidase [Pirellula sp.]|jgi:beta-lactamase regulating signal transducer with metallopeptidase domain/thiol-disulfide isomerase/thioredoxin/uncharacterized GH25 family protein|nr:carboxypeptidase regulatory-like domain-containing protein [Pirellula sp.]
MFQKFLNLVELAAFELWSWMGPMAWQAAILVLVLFVVSRFVLSKTSARFRYALWLLVPIRLVLPPTLAFVTGWAWWVMPIQSSREPLQPSQSSEVSVLSLAPSHYGGFNEPNRSGDLHRASNVRNGQETLLSANYPTASGSTDSLADVPEVDDPKSPQTASEIARPTYGAMRYGATYLFGIYLLGFNIMLVRMIVCYNSVARLLRSSKAANSDLLRLTDECRSLLGLQKRVPVLVTSESVSPMLVGFWRPVIVLPDGIQQLLAPEELRSILVHELHHLQRNDMIIHFVEMLLQAFYWFHPAVWLAGRESRRMREMACDEGTIAALKGQRRAYGLGIVKIADMMTNTAPALTLPVLVARNQMSARVFRILDPNLPIGKRLSLPAIVGILGLAFVLIPSAGQNGIQAIDPSDARVESSEEFDAGLESLETSSAVEQDKTTQKKLLVKVIDEEGKAIQGVQIHSSSWTNDPAYKDKANVDFTTNDLGFAELEVYPQLEILRIWATRADRAGLFIHWEKGETDQIPETITVLLQKGAELGGRVVDTRGDPVADAKVQVSLENGGEKLDTNLNSRLNEWLAYGSNAAITDTEGRWFIKNAPSGNDLELRLTVLHPEFLCDSNSRSIAKFGLTLDSMRDKSATIKLETGISIHGRVFDPEGNPVNDALIVWGDRPYSETGSQETKTNQRGEYSIPQRNPGKIRLSVVAKNWMPQTLLVEASDGLSPVDFYLQPGRKLHFRVQDSNGKPVPNAYVSLEKWKQVESLYNVKHPNVLPTGIPNRTDKNGEFLWDWAPDDAISWNISVIKDNEQIYQKSIDLTASDAMQVLTLQPKLSISGNVVDSKTNQPVSEFSMTAITYWSESESARGIAQSSSLKKFSTSDFRFSYSSNDVKQLVFQIEAPGYRVYRTRRYGVSEPPQTLTIQLEPTPIQTGRVRDSNGANISKAKVFLVKPDDSLMISDSKDYFSGMSPASLRLDEQGVFAHATQESNYAIVVASDEGYAEKYYGPGEPASDLILKPWARVEGYLFQEGKPVADALIMLRPIRQLGGDNPHVQDNFQTRTDTNGKFIFSKVPSVPSTVGSLLSSWEDYPITSSQFLPIELNPGETKTVNLGGDGLQIHGRVQLKGDGAEKIEFRYGIHQMVRVDGGEIAVPSHARKGPEYKAGEQREFEQKLAGASGSVLGMEQHTVKLNPDGTFMINGVRPGKYRFLLQVYEPPTGCLVDPVGYGYLEFDTRDYAITNNSMNLGTIEISLKPAPKVGQPLTNFTWQDLAEKRHSLDEYRGKFVLLDFWATWCGPCMKSIPEMARIHESVANSKDVQLISLSIDSEMEAAKEVIREKKLNWTQGFIGDIVASPTGKALGIHSVPLYVLIDQQGVVVLRTRNIEEITQRMQDFEKE